MTHIPYKKNRVVHHLLHYNPSYVEEGLLHGEEGNDGVALSGAEGQDPMWCVYDKICCDDRDANPLDMLKRYSRIEESAPVPYIGGNVHDSDGSSSSSSTMHTCVIHCRDTVILHGAPRPAVQQAFLGLIEEWLQDIAVEERKMPPVVAKETLCAPAYTHCCCCCNTYYYNVCRIYSWGVVDLLDEAHASHYHRPSTSRETSRPSVLSALLFTPALRPSVPQGAQRVDAGVRLQYHPLHTQDGRIVATLWHAVRAACLVPEGHSVLCVSFARGAAARQGEEDVGGQMKESKPISALCGETSVRVARQVCLLPQLRAANRHMRDDLDNLHDMLTHSPDAAPTQPLSPLTQLVMQQTADYRGAVLTEVAAVTHQVYLLTVLGKRKSSLRAAPRADVMDCQLHCRFGCRRCCPATHYYDEESTSLARLSSYTLSRTDTPQPVAPPTVVVDTAVTTVSLCRTPPLHILQTTTMSSSETQRSVQRACRDVTRRPILSPTPTAAAAVVERRLWSEPVTEESVAGLTQSRSWHRDTAASTVTCDHGRVLIAEVHHTPPMCEVVGDGSTYSAVEGNTNGSIHIASREEDSVIVTRLTRVVDALRAEKRALERAKAAVMAELETGLRTLEQRETQMLTTVERAEAMLDVNVAVAHAQEQGALERLRALLPQTTAPR